MILMMKKNIDVKQKDQDIPKYLKTCRRYIIEFKYTCYSKLKYKT